MYQPDPDRALRFRVAVRRFGPFESAIAAQWAAFEAQAHTGLRFEAVPLDLQALETALFTSGGMRDQAWDVAFVPTDWIPSMQNLGCAVDLQPLIAADPPDGYPDAWAPSLLGLQHVGGSVLGLPYHDGPECLIFRRDLFESPALKSEYLERFGRPLQPPDTWAEFQQVARFLDGREKGLHGAVFAAFPDGHNSVYDFLLQLWSRGGDLFADGAEPRFSTAVAREGLAFYREMLQDRSATHPDSASLDSVAAGQRFAAGQAAMMVNWFGFAAYAHTAADSAVQGLVDVAKIPAGSGGQSVSLNVYWVLSIAHGSPHAEVAWRFLRHTATAPMDKLTTVHGAIGCRRSTWNDPEVNASIPFYRRLGDLHAAATEIPQRRDWPDIAAVIDTMMSDTATTSIPVEDLLARADEQLRARREHGTRS